MTAPIAVLTYYNVNGSWSGGARRINELLGAIGADRAWLIQPGESHPAYRTDSFHPDFGRRRVGINWGMFNLYWPPTAGVVRNRIVTTPPSCTVLTSIWAWAPFARSGAPGPMLLDAQNVDAVAIEERFGGRHPFTRMVARREARVLRSVELIFACSEIDRDHFVGRYGISAERVRVVPNGADFPEEDLLVSRPLDEDVEARLGRARVLLFVGGKLDYPPNAEGLAFIRDRLMPELERRDPGGYRVMVIGTPPPKDDPHPSILYMGRVPSLEPYMRRADVGLAPIFSGSGTRLKILDYLAWGKPVVSTAKGAEGIACRDGEHLALASREDFAGAVHRLAQDPEQAARLGRNGRRLIRTRYAWSAIREQWRAGLAPWL